jgi:hypothetical protein
VASTTGRYTTSSRAWATANDSGTSATTLLPETADHELHRRAVGMRAADVSEEGRADAQFLAGFVDRFPALRFVVRRVVAEGDLVVTHGVLTLDAEDRGSAVADVMRFEDGRVVEHWDVVQALPDDPANANGMC